MFYDSNGTEGSRIIGSDSNLSVRRRIASAVTLQAPGMWLSTPT